MFPSASWDVAPSCGVKDGIKANHRNGKEMITMLDLDQLQRIIEDNHLPAEIIESGRTWVRVELTDQLTGLGWAEFMSMSDFADLVLDWRDHGCHEHPCPAMVLQGAA